MFQTAVHEALKKQSSLKAAADARAAGALDAAAKLSDVLADSLNEEVREIYETQKLLEAESQLLRRELSEARISLTAWQAKLKVVQEALKEAGDLEHYIEYLGREAALIARVSTELGICSPRGSEGGLLPPTPASADAAAPAAAAAAGAGAAAVLDTEGLAAAGRLGEVPSGGAEGGVAGQQEGEQGGAAGGSGEGGLPVSGSLPLSCGASR